MTKEDHKEQQVWEHLHVGEPLPNGMQADPAAERIHRELKELLPLADQTDDELEKAITGQWDAHCSKRAEKDMAAAASAPDNRPKAIHEQRSPLLRPLHGILALAACCLLLVGLHNYSTPSISWQNPGLYPAAYRSVDESMPMYTTSQLKDWAGRVQGAIQKAYDAEPGAASKRSILTSRRPWSVQITLEELDHGALLLRIDGYQDSKENPVYTRETLLEKPSDDFMMEFGRECALDLVSRAPTRG